MRFALLISLIVAPHPVQAGGLLRRARRLRDGANRFLINRALPAHGRRLQARLDRADTVPGLARAASHEPAGSTAAQIVERFKHIAGPRLTHLLVNPNVVLTLAGARGQTEAFLDSPTRAELRAIDRLGAELIKYGINFHGISPLLPGTLGINVESLSGYAVTTRESQLVPAPFDVASGWRGLSSWYASVYHFLSDRLPQVSEEDRVHAVAGVSKGYPDRAILDLLDPRNDPQQMETTKIRHAGRYDGAWPDFSFARRSCGDRSIARTERQWGRILSEFYRSPEYQRIVTGSGAF